MSSNKHVLLVDDDELSIAFNKFIIEEYDPSLQITVCKNGIEAKKYFEQASQYPDLVVLDINMPLMDGFEFLDWYVQHALNTTKIVMCSTSGLQEEKDRSFAYGKNIIGYLEKPINQQKLKPIFELL